MPSFNAFGRIPFSGTGPGNTVRIFRHPDGWNLGIGGFELLDGSRKPVTTINTLEYSTLAVLTLDCLTTNEGGRPVAMEAFNAAYLYHYSNAAWVAFLNFLPIVAYGSDEAGDAKPALPHLLTPGEEAHYYLKVAWPLEDQARAKFIEACPETFLAGTRMQAVTSCLRANGLKLSDNPGWPGTRKLQIVVTEAGGKQHHASMFYQLDEDEYHFR
jgi:hypothetical protein